MAKEKLELIVEVEQSDPREYQVMKGGFWICRFAKTSNEKMVKRVQEKIHKRDVSWENDLHKHIITSTDLWIKPDEVYVFVELGIIEFWQAVKDQWIEVNNVSLKPNQKTIKESS